MPDNANLDTIAPDGSLSGEVALRLMQSNFNVNALRTYDVLRKDEWELFDTTLVQIARERLVITQDLMQRGLVMPIQNALGTTLIQWEQVSELTPAEVTMNGLSDAQRDRVEFAQKNLPLPIVHKDFSLNIRNLASSRRLGQPLDTTQLALATRVVVEKIEDMIMNGLSSFAVGGYGVQGFTTATNRNTGSTTADWESTTTGAQFVADFIAAIDALQGDHMYGPYGVYTTYTAYNRMLDDYKTDSDKTILQRLLEIPSIQFIRPTERLSAGAAVFVQLTSDVVDLIDGIQPTVVQWTSHGGMVFHFKVMAIIVPRVKDDYDTQSGILHLT